MNKFREFLGSIYFIILVNILTVIFWQIQKPIMAYIFYLIVFIIVILTNANRMIISTLILCSIINFRIVQSDNYMSVYEGNTKVFLPLGVIVFGFLIYDFIRYKRKIKFKNDIFYGLLAILGASILSLINLNQETYKLIIIGILQTLGFVLIFLMFYNYKDKGAQDYFAKSVLILGVSIAVELILHYQDLGIISGKNDHNINWGISNSISMFYLVIIPTSLYLYYKNQKNFIVLLVTGLNFLMTLFMLSRGTYFTLILIAIPFLITSFYLVKNKKGYMVDLSIVLLICTIITYFIIKRFEVLDVVTDYLKSINFLNPNGRSGVYKTGVSLFKRFPLFGSGAYSGAYYLRLEGFHVSTYHNYFIQTLATIGGIGFISFIYYLFTIYKSVIVKSKYNIMIMFAVLALMIQGLVDNAFYSPIFMIFLSMALPLLTTKEEKITE